MKRSGDCTGASTSGYGFLFSVRGWRRRQDRQRDVQALAQVEGGVVDRQAVGGGPQLQGVAGAAALEAMERVRAGVDAEATSGAHGRAVQGTGTALLAGVVGAWHEAQQREHLGDRDGGADRGEIDGGTRRIRSRLDLFVAGLPHRFAAFAGLGELAIACGEDDGVVARSLSLGVT